VRGGPVHYHRRVPSEALMMQRALGIVGFIGFLLVVNVISYACDWGYVFY
jgi:hypothetical protein